MKLAVGVLLVEVSRISHSIPGGILWKAGAPKNTSLVKEKGSMYVCYECFYECICDAQMCTQGHGLVCVCVCVCVCVSS